MPDIAEPIRIISDVHLGHPACILRSADQLRPIFEGARTVIFNGDSAELRYKAGHTHGLENYIALEKTARLCGATPIFINGNHDPESAHLDHLDLCENRILVTHGDLLYHEIAPWGDHAGFLANKHSEALAALPSESLQHFESRLRANKAASIALFLHEPDLPRGQFARFLTHLQTLWPPWKPFALIRIWTETPGMAAALAEKFRPQAKCVIFGHTHWAGVWQRRRRTIINTGGYLSVLGRSCVEIHDGTLRVFRVERKKEAFALGKLLWTSPDGFLSTPEPVGIPPSQNDGQT